MKWIKTNKNILKKAVLFIVLVCLISCSNENINSCNVQKVNIGYSQNGGPEAEYFQELFYTYTNEIVSKVEVFDTENQETIETIEFDFDPKGRLYQSVAQNKDNETTYSKFEYRDNFLFEKRYQLDANSDTLYSTLDKFLYIENPSEEKIYRYNSNMMNYSCKFKAGNLYEFGTYELIENDTIDTFENRFYYDNRPNTFYIPEYRVGIPHEFRIATVSAQNNLIEIEYINSDLRLNYYFEYDSSNKLSRYKGKSGLISDFQYDCD